MKEARVDPDVLTNGPTDGIMKCSHVFGMPAWFEVPMSVPICIILLYQINLN